MKNKIKSALVIAFASTLLINPFLTPSVASAATVIGYTQDKESKYMKIQYSLNDPLYIRQGETRALANLGNNGHWHVEAGEMLTFNVNLMQESEFRWTIINSSTGQTLYTDTVESTTGISVTWPFFDQTGEYVILLTPTTASALLIDWFYVDID